MQERWGWTAGDVVAEESGHVNNEWKTEDHTSSTETEGRQWGFLEL